MRTDGLLYYTLATRWTQSTMNLIIKHLPWLGVISLYLSTANPVRMSGTAKPKLWRFYVAGSSVNKSGKKPEETPPLRCVHRSTHVRAPCIYDKYFSSKSESPWRHLVCWLQSINVPKVKQPELRCYLNVLSYVSDMASASPGRIRGARWVSTTSWRERASHLWLRLNICAVVFGPQLLAIAGQK